MLPVLAVIAGAAASAFTTVQTNTAQNDAKDVASYWYRWNSDQTVGAELSTQEVTEAEAEQITGCPKKTTEDCARGYEDPQTPGQSQNESPVDFLSIQTN